MVNNEFDSNELKDDSDLVEKVEHTNPIFIRDLIYFMLGLGLLIIGAYLAITKTKLEYSFNLKEVLGFNPPLFLILLPLLFGIVFLSLNEKSRLGWIFTIFGVLTACLGIILGLHISLRPSPLFWRLMTLGSVTSGIALIFKALIEKH